MHSLEQLEQNEKPIAELISIYMLTNGNGNAQWYVGITNDINRRLFDEHKVDPDNDTYSFWEADSLKAADSIERFILKEYPRVQGHPGLGQDDSVHVYIYKIGPNTVEQTNK